jgi:hypothetical protein
MERNMSIEKIYNVETGETIEVPLTNEAIAELNKQQAKIEAQEIAANEKLQARIEVLNKLGLTAQDLKALGL